MNHFLSHHLPAALKPLSLVIIGIALTGGTPSISWAQTGSAEVQTQVRNYNLPSAPLAEQLLRISREAGLVLTVDAALVQGKTAAAVHGSMNAAQALQLALAGSGLELISNTSGGYSLRLLANGAAAVLPTVNVSDQILGQTTENSGSYTTGGVTAGSKMEQSLREVPRSISVIGREQLNDQRITTFDEALEQLPGVTFEPITNGWGAGAITVRGHSLTNITIDGAPSRGQSDGDTSFNTGMAKYDNIQLLRGPDGLFSGNGQPSGSINLVRKRPVESFQVNTVLSAGRWNNYLGEVDVSSPLTDSGAVKGRMVVSHNDSEKFFDNAHRKNLTLYGVIETRFNDSTTLLAGISQDRKWGEGQDYAPAFPRYSDGSILPVSRNFGLLGSSYRDSDSVNYFGEIVHQLNTNWSLKTNFSRTESEGKTIGSFYVGAADPLTGTGSTIYQSPVHDWNSDATAADINLSGDFEIMGREGKLVAGADYLRTTNDWTQTHATFNGYVTGAAIPIDWLSFDPSSFQNYTVADNIFDDRNTRNSQLGGYFYGSLQVYGPLKAIVGGRYSRYEYVRHDDALIGKPAVTENNRNHDVFIPYYALIYDFARDWSLYFTTTEGFESQSNRYNESYEPLDPAKGRSFELGLKGEHFEGKLNTNITFYRSKRNNVAVLVNTDRDFADINPGLSCCYSNDGEFLSQGIELDVSGELLPGLQINAGYTFDDNQTEYGSNTGQRFTTNTPKHIFRAWTRYQLPNALSAFSIGGGVKAQSSYFRSGTVRSWNPTGGTDGAGAFDGPNLPYEFTESGRALWNLFAEYRVHHNWTASLNVNNLFDKHYFRSVDTTRLGNIYGEPRNVMVTLRGKF